MSTTTTIWVTFRKEGIHYYPIAATDPKLDDVKFLGSPHRHMFHFTVELQVLHNDRDVEFIQFKRELENLYSEDGPLEMDYKSCEMLAEDMLEYITDNYPRRDCTITISEDGENGATLRYKHD